VKRSIGKYRIQLHLNMTNTERCYIKFERKVLVSQELRHMDILTHVNLHPFTNIRLYLL
jgi:hypothetical protein